MEYTITKNANFNSLEIIFNGIPSAAVRAAIRKLKYRWNAAKKLWYGFADEETTREAIDNADKTDAPAKPATVAKASKPRAASLWERTRTDKLPAYGTDNEIKTAIKELAKAKNWGYDRAAAAYFREHLKKQFPEVKFSITSGGAGWLDNCDIRIIASPYARILVKGNPDATNWRDLGDHYENGEQLEAIYQYCKKLFNSADADDGDVYADYGAHHDLYGDVTISSEYSQTEATDEQNSDAARLVMTIAGKRNGLEYIIKDGNAAIYRGKLPPIPESLKRDIVRRENGVVSYFVRNVGSTAREYMRDVIEFYAEKGFTPIIDTIQR